MKKTFVFRLVIVLTLTLTLMAACGGNEKSGGDKASDDGAPPASADNGSGGDSGKSSTDTDKPAKDEPRAIRAPEVTVSPGDEIFSDEIMYMGYDSISSDGTYILCKFNVKTTQAIAIHNDRDPMVVNGIVTDYSDLGFKMLRPYEGKPVGRGEHAITFDQGNWSALEEAGITYEELKTIQATITITDLDDFDDVLFEITVLFNIEH